jgi:hypothetical protein
MTDKKAYGEAWDQLHTIAGDDSVYLVWKETYEAAAAEFEAYVNQQPDDVRQILWAYAESGRLMNQRLVNLACEHMRFPQKKKSV